VDATLPEVSSSKTICVDDDFDDDPSGHRWDTIQEGVDDASDGDTVIVYAGEYVENVDVDKSITLEGEGADVVMVRAADASDDIFYVTADYVNISGFTVTGATDSYGIFLYWSDHNTLQSNTASNNRYGIWMWCSSNNTLQNNTMSGNEWNFGVDGWSLSDYAQNIDTSNTVDGNPIYYWVGQKDMAIPSDAGYVGVVNSTNITVRDLTLMNNYHGVLFAYTNDSRIKNVDAPNNEYGIYLRESSSNIITGNNASCNQWHGICIYSSNNNALSGNTASDNYHGIFLRCSSNNTLQNNIMSGNAYNFGVGGGSLSCYTQNIDTSNTVDGNPIYYWVDQKDMQIPSDAGFVGVVNSTNITVRDLTLTNNTQGVLFAYTDNSGIENVTTSNNWYSVDLRFSSNNILSGNTANSNNYGTYIGDSNNNTLENNNASNNNDGIYLDDSSNNTLTCNTANSNGEGIYLYRSCNNILSRNIANSNYGRGIRLTSSSNNTLSENIANSNNWCGIFIQDSGSNTIYHNNLINNTQNAYDEWIGAWDSGSEGNYYSDYTGNDTDRDGIGEDPYRRRWQCGQLSAHVSVDSAAERRPQRRRPDHPRRRRDHACNRSRRFHLVGPSDTRRR